MAFMEIVTGDGKTVSKQVISATDMQAFGTKKLSIPFDATGKKWVRFSMWDVAGNGGFTQPQWLTGTGTRTDEEKEKKPKSEKSTGSPVLLGRVFLTI